MLKRLPSYDGGPLLYLVVTPLGNLSDIAPRVIEALKASSRIYAEDTRNARKLLSYLGIEGKLLSSIRSQNERDEAAKAIALLKEEGGAIAYMSDAGHPCLSDPGAALVHEAVAQGIASTVVPATSAALAAYCLSGFPEARFYFQGFLPLSGKERKAVIEAIKERKEPTIVYEAPSRIVKTLKDLEEVVGEEREISLSREISKIHEETIHGTLGDFSTLEEGSLRGEIAFVVEGSKEEAKAISEDELDAYIKRHLSLGKGAVKAAMEDLGVGRKAAYASYLRVKD